LSSNTGRARRPEGRARGFLSSLSFYRSLLSFVGSPDFGEKEASRSSPSSFLHSSRPSLLPVETLTHGALLPKSGTKIPDFAPMAEFPCALPTNESEAKGQKEVNGKKRKRRTKKKR